MYDVLARTLPLVALAFLATAMFSLGLELTMRQIVEPLRDRRLLASSLLANVVVVPLIAVLLSRVIPMHEALAIGIVVYALAAGTEGGPKFVQIAGGNAGFAIGLLAVLLTFTIVLMPVALSFVVPGAHVDRGGLLVKLMLAVAVPVGLGLFLRARFTAFAVRLAVVVHRGSLIFLALFFLQVVYVNFDEMLTLEPGAMLAGTLFFAFSFVAAYLLGGREQEPSLARHHVVRAQCPDFDDDGHPGLPARAGRDGHGHRDGGGVGGVRGRRGGRIPPVWRLRRRRISGSGWQAGLPPGTHALAQPR